MRNKFGKLCMILGAALVLGALSLVVYNRLEANQAEQASSELMSQLTAAIEPKNSSTSEQPISTPLEYLDPGDLEMTQVEIDGHYYIGYLSIPKLELELPVMADWSYPALKIAPCRYSGSIRGQDLVIMAHNYARHFGQLSELSPGDSVTFTDMNGIITEYQVVGLDILAPTAVEEMTSGDFDLTLFTCTYGGQSRVTVYCDFEKQDGE